MYPVILSNIFYVVKYYDLMNSLLMDSITSPQYITNSVPSHIVEHGIGIVFVP